MLRRSMPAAIVAIGLLAGPSSARGEMRQIDTAQSKLTVYVYKAGLFSGFADDHIVDAPIASGTLSDAAPLAVAVEVHAADLKVRDPKLAADKRNEVQARMVGPDVLDVQKFASIAFESTNVDPAGADRWTVTGRLTVHGQARTVSFPVALMSGHYRGATTIKQRDFGITPISIAGGTVKVKDELKVEFDIVTK